MKKSGRNAKSHRGGRQTPDSVNRGSAGSTDAEPLRTDEPVDQEFEPESPTDNSAHLPGGVTTSDSEPDRDR